MASKNTICPGYDSDALDAANFYAKTFPDSAVGALLRAPGNYPDPAAAKRAFKAMVTMGKIDIAAIEAARKG